MNNHLSMKNVKYDWIGSIPFNWELKRIKYVFWERKENNNPIKSDNLISLTIEKGVIPHAEKTGGGNKPKEDLTKYKLVYPGDIVLNSMNVIAGAVGISKYFGVVSPVYYMLIPKNINYSKAYFHHLFRAETFQKSLYGLGNGILIKENEETGKLNTIRMRIPMDKLGDQFIPIPPPEEQELIAKYLDKKTNQIYSMIENVKKKIKLLNEKKNSVINEVLTKGLEPNAEMVDSGVKWIGRIPKEWDVKKLKYFCKMITEKGLTNQKDIKISPENVESNTGQCLNLHSEYSGEGVRFNKGDILLNKLRLYLKKILFTNYEGYSMGEMIVLRVFSGVKKFYFFSFFNQVLIDELDNQSTGVKLPRVSPEIILNTKFPCPPISEQNKIVSYLDKQIQLIDKELSIQERRIKLLNEYLQSLISSVATGKIKVTRNIL